MDRNKTQDLLDAVKCLRQGGVIAYPTEAVYGLGCDPDSIDAVARILQIKNRSIKKGFIIIASDWNQLESFVEPIDPQALARVFATWPGAVTWAFPQCPATLKRVIPPRRASSRRPVSPTRE